MFLIAEKISTFVIQKAGPMGVGTPSVCSQILTKSEEICHQLKQISVKFEHIHCSQPDLRESAENSALLTNDLKYRLDCVEEKSLSAVKLTRQNMGNSRNRKEDIRLAIKFRRTAIKERRICISKRMPSRRT